MTLYKRARKTVAPLVNAASGVMIGGLMRGGVLYDQRNFERWARHGFYVVSRTHFYHPLPDIYEVRERATVNRPDPMAGIDVREADQLVLVSSLAEEYGAELHRIAEGTDTGYVFQNGTFESLDGALYWCLLRRFAPKRIVEIGSGNSTRLALAYLRDYPDTRLLVVDPYPGEELAGMLGARLVRERLEDTIGLPFRELRAGDMLFVDSSHVVKSGGDVNRLILEIMPRLAPGVLVHVHDIFLPCDYPLAFYEQGRFWTEQYLLQAYLCENPHVEIVAMSHLLATRHRDRLARLFPMLDGIWGASLWFCRR